MLFKKKDKSKNLYLETYFKNSFSVILSGMMRDYEYDKYTPSKKISHIMHITTFVQSKSFNKVIKQSEELYLDGNLDKEKLFSLINDSKWIQEYKKATNKQFDFGGLNFKHFDTFLVEASLLNRMEPNTAIKEKEQEFHDEIEPCVQRCFMLKGKLNDQYYPFINFQKGQPYYEETFERFRMLCEQNKNLTARQALEATLDYYKIGATTTRVLWNPEPYDNLNKAYKEFVKKHDLLNISKNKIDSVDEKKQKHRKRMP